MPSSIKYEHPRDHENFKNGFSDGSLDAKEGVFSLCAAKKCRAQNPYERGYTLGYKKGARQNKSQRKSIDPLIDSPGKTMGSDFNGDGIHDVLIGAYQGDGSGSFDANRGEVHIFFGATTFSGHKAASTADVQIQGKADSDWMGRSVSSAGDVNGDGIDDILIGAQNNGDSGDTYGGAAYIFFGSTSLSGTQNLATTASADMTILGKGAGTNKLGSSVSGAGDINGDGFDDVIVGAYGNDDVATNAGAAYIFFGAGNLSGTKSLGGAQSADVTILGKVASDLLGLSVSGAGDINGDGFDDIIVGAPRNDAVATSAGEVYIFFGASNLSGTKNLDTTASPDVTFQGRAGGYGGRNGMGTVVSGLGDVNGDGFDDIICADYNDDGGDPGGEAYIFFGASTLSGTKSVNAANVTFLKKTTADYLGRSVSGAGDVNDDGFDDVIIGANQDDASGTNRGAAYIFFGASDLSGTKNLATTASADVTILGQVSVLGESVSGVGDVNADGIPDFGVGERLNTFVATNAGAVFLIFGSTTLSGTKNLLSTAPDVTVTGTQNDGLGQVGGGRDSPGP